MPSPNKPDAEVLECLAAIEEMAKTTFETEDDARVWLERPHPLLDGESPLEAAKTTTGAQHVKQILIAIKYGGAV